MQPSTSSRLIRPTLAVLSVGALAVGLAACGGSDTAKSSATQTVSAPQSASASATVSATSSASPSQTTDETKPHVHAPLDGGGIVIGAADKGGSTHVTGTLTNEGTQPVTITSGSSDFAESVELHKTVNGTMTVDTAGWTIKPGETLTLTEGGFHINVKGLKGALKKGDRVEVHLETTAGPAHLELVVGEASVVHHEH